MGRRGGERGAEDARLDGGASGLGRGVCVLCITKALALNMRGGEERQTHLLGPPWRRPWPASSSPGIPSGGNDSPRPPRQALEDSQVNLGHLRPGLYHEWGGERKPRLATSRRAMDFPHLGEDSGVPWMLGGAEAFSVVGGASKRALCFSRTR